MCIRDSEESPDLPLEVRERYTGITLDKAYRLEELLDEFFEITRYNLQTIPIERSRFDAALFVNQVVDEFFPLAEGRRLNLVYEGPAELSVFADAGRVARVLNNVIKNAVAYADPGTDVRVRTGLVTAADGFVWWELTVSDQGRELSPQHLERIFEKFYRADESRGSAAVSYTHLSAAPERRRAAAAIAKGCAARRMRRACGFREHKRGVGAERDKRSGSGEALHRRNWCTARGASSKALDTGIARRRPGLRPGRPPAALAARRPRRQVSLGRAPPVPEETSTDCLSFP